MHALIKGFQHVFCSDSHRASHRRLAHRLALAVLSIAALVATSPYARADGDPPSLDPRANALGGGGITFSAGSAGLGINPSLMQYTTGKGDFMSSAYLLHTRIDAPVSGPYTHDSSSVYSPVGDFAAAWRLSPKLVVGIGLQPVTGAGANFHLAGGSQERAIFVVMEADAGVSYAVTKKLSIGAAYRPSYFSGNITQLAPGSFFRAVEARTDFLGAVVGIQYTPEPKTHLAVVYRTRITAKLDGTVTTPGGFFHGTSQYASPDKISLGIDHHFLYDRLLLASQGEILLYGALPGTTYETVTTPMGTLSTPLVANDKNIYHIKVGAEFWVVPKLVAVSAGVYYGPNENNPAYVTSYAPYLGHTTAPTAGLGFRHGKMDIGASVNWQIRGGATVASTANGYPGKYSQGGVIAGAGVLYHF